MRVIAGQARGTRLRVPQLKGLRPTGDRARETLFNVIVSELLEARVLDLFAGSGALGIEAISRGAASAVFVERHRVAVRAIEDNLAKCRMQERGRVIRADWRRALQRLRHSGVSFDLVFLDPPYASGQGQACLEALAQSDLLAPTGLLVVEHRRGHGPQIPDGLHTVRELDIGDTALWLVRCVAGDAAPC